MKNIILFLSLAFVVGCSGGSGGGVTSDPTPQPTISPTPSPSPSPTPPPPQPVFNTAQSYLRVTDLTGTPITTNGRVGVTYKIVLNARDQFGNNFSSSNIKVGLRNVSSLMDLAPTQTSAGQYEVSFPFELQGAFTAYVKIDNLEYSTIDYNFSVSFCNNPSNPAAAPFHDIVNYQSKSYSVICTTSQLVAASNSAHLNKNLILGNFMDLSSYYVDANLDSIPDNQFKIGSLANPFIGEFNGASFLIRGFKYISATESDVGLFGVVGNGAIVRDISLIEAQTKGVSNIGSLIGSIQTDSGAPVMVQSILASDNSPIGEDSVGGLIGSINSPQSLATVDNVYCYSNQNLSLFSSDVSRLGGVIGSNTGGRVTNINAHHYLLNNNSLITVTNAGGVIGEDLGSGSLWENVSVYSQSNFDDLTNTQNFGCLAGSASGSSISNVASGTYCVISQPILTSSNISGLIGQMSNVTINDIVASIDASGDFSQISGLSNSISTSTVSNVRLSGTLSSASGLIGGLAASATLSSFSEIISYVAINSPTTPSGVGGILAISNQNSLDKITTQSPVYAPLARNVGGLIGIGNGNNTLTNSYNNASITGRENVGGLIGYSSFANSGLITTSYSSGAITGEDAVGGIVGMLDGTNVTVDSVFSLSSIQNFSSSFPTNAGAIVGIQMGSTVVSNSFFLSEATILNIGCGVATSCLTIDTNTPASYQDDVRYYMIPSNQPLSNWDNNIWNIGEPYLPYLK